MPYMYISCVDASLMKSHPSFLAMLYISGVYFYFLNVLKFISSIEEGGGQWNDEEFYSKENEF